MNTATRTLTFLFTDIEGSTRLWEEHPQAMQIALRRHDELLRHAIERHNGRVFKTVGDAFCAAFEAPPDAVAAAADAQRALAGEPWPTQLGALRSRMGIHTGAVEERDQDYFGPPLNRVARLESSAHGGQIVLSVATQELVRDALPPDFELIELGTYRLKDLLRPERIFQVVVPGLSREFPPLRTLDTRRSNLPSERTPFVGRAREVAAVESLIRRPEVRLVTLTGPGGTGKTRLSLKVASHLEEEFSDGVWFVELETVTTADGLIGAIAAVFGVRSEAASLAGAVCDHLGDRSVLLVLDNFEQLVASAGVVGQILEASPRVKVMTSSRERLRVYGEHDFPVPPLGLPETRRAQTPAVIAEYEAVRLFAQRARVARSDFAITDENAEAVAAICVRLDGLPLAIELAAARVRSFAPRAILDRLHDRLAMLTGGARDVPSRQQTIRGAIDWSYELLDEAEQRLFRALGVFSGGWSVDAAESVFPDGHDAVSALESFVDKSLVGETIGPGGESRFAMLETIREYASEKLRASGEYDTGAASHADYYVAFVERFGYSMDEERDFIGLYPILIAEIDNVRRALSWSCDNANRTLALRLLAPMWQVWHWLGRQSEGAQWVSRALRIPGDAPPIVEAHAYRTAANLSLAGADKASNERCRRYYARAARLYREAGYDAGVQGCLSNIGITYANNGELEQAIRYFTHSYRVARAKDNHGASRLAVMNLSDAYFRAGDRARAVACAKKALELAHLSGAQSGVCHALYGYAKTLVDVGRLDEARPIAREAIEALIDPQTGVYMAVPMAHCVLLQARLGALAADHARVGRLLGIVEALAPIAELGFDWGHSEMYGRLVSEARSALGDDVYERECSTGASMPPEDIVAFVLSDA